jgi:predicted O-methyltransferase YrrM
MILTGSEQAILGRLREMYPDAPALPAVKRQLLEYQMVALYGLAKQYDRPNARILEIGTGHGASGYMLSRAAPSARILSLTVDSKAAATAAALWQTGRCANIECRLEASWDYHERQRPVDRWDMVFVDGDHNQIARDLPWFNHLVTGGLLLCHDYSPADSARPSIVCHRTLDLFAAHMAHPFDVSIIDDTKTGMVGFYRRAGESWGAA